MVIFWQIIGLSVIFAGVIAIAVVLRGLMSFRFAVSWFRRSPRGFEVKPIMGQLFENDPDGGACETASPAKTVSAVSDCDEVGRAARRD
jgi:hypothetical protein